MAAIFPGCHGQPGRSQDLKMEVTGFLQEHWVSILVASYLIGMTVYGHHRGFLRLSISLAALVLSALVIRFAMPPVTAFIKENSEIRQWVGQIMLEKAGLGEGGEGGLALPAQQRAAIEGTELPEALKRALIENNNDEIYRMLGVEAFVDYVASYLADRIIHTLAFVILFLAVYIGIRLLAHALDLIARLPVLYGMNQIAGALLGLIQALAYFWIFCLVLELFAGTGWGRYLLDSMESVPWVCFLCHHNLLAGLAPGILHGLL